jgi:hypothetical protein
VLAYLIHDPLDRTLRDPYDNRDVLRDDASEHRLEDGSCLELVGAAHTLDFKLVACLEKKLRSMPLFHSVQLKPLATMAMLRAKVSEMRRSGVQLFPILMEREIASGLVIIVGCKSSNQHFLGTLDDLLDILREGDYFDEGGGEITRVSLWDQCK